MSGIAGVWNKNGQPLDHSLLTALSGCVSLRGGDGSGVWLSYHIGFALQAFWTTPESFGETAPFLDSASGVAIVMDGRLDNRVELQDLLHQPPAVPDSRLALHAFLKWGNAFPERLLGDFAIAIWDPRSQSLFCVRDRLGLKPLYFADTPHVFVFASELRAVLGHPAVSHQHDEGMLAELLSNEIHSLTGTPFAAVSRLEPRHVLTVTSSRSIRHAYWFPSLAERRFPSVDACADELLHLLKTAVECRLRSTGPLATYLSGGLDSSAITALACQLRPHARIQTFSAVYPGLAADESFYIDQTAQRYPALSHRAPFVAPEPDYFATWAARYRDFPGYPNGNALLHSLAPYQQARGVRVILGGHGGNQLLDGSPSVILDSLQSLHLRELHRYCRGYAMDGAVLPVVFALAVRPFLPDRAALRRALGRPSSPFFPLHPDFIRRSSLASRIPAQPHWRTFGSRARRDMVTSLFSGWEAHHLGQLDRDAAAYGFEERAPFLDSRLIEFCIQLPESMRQREGVWKYILRRAVTPLLPPAVVRRKVQADFTVPSLRVVGSQTPPDPKHLSGYVLPEVLAAITAGGVPALMALSDLGLWRKWAILGVNHFLAAEDRRG